MDTSFSQPGSQPAHYNRAICTIGCLCCAKLIAHNEPCSCWKPVATATISTQTDPGISYGYSSDSYFTRGNVAHSLLHRAIRTLDEVSDNRHKTIGIVREMFPEIRSSPKTNKKLNRAIRRSKVNRQYYGNLKQRAETQGQTVRQMLNKTKRLESTCPLDDQTSTDLMTIDPDREPEFNQQDDSDTNNTDLEANTPVEANKTAGANITIRAEIHHKSNDTDHHDHIIYEATPIQDLDAAKPTDEISTVPTEEKSTVPTDEISTVPTDEISTVPTDEISTVPTEEKSTVPTDEIPADEAWEKN